MLAEFLSLPLPVIVVISVLVPVAVVIPIALKVSNAHVTSEEDSSFHGLVALFGFIGTAFTLLLAFIIVNVQGDQARAQRSLFAETTALESMIKETRALEPALAPQIKTLVLDYLTVMRTNEIRVSPPPGGDPLADAAFEKIVKRLDKLDRESSTGAARVLLAKADTLAELRDTRVDTPAGTLDAITSGICVVLGLITAAVMALLPAPRRWVKWVQTLGVAVAVGLVVSMMFYIASDAYTKAAEDTQISRVVNAYRHRRPDPARRPRRLTGSPPRGPGANYHRTACHPTVARRGENCDPSAS